LAEVFKWIFQILSPLIGWSKTWFEFG